MTKVSVIIAAYNMEKYIQACVESLLKQTLTEIELLIVDDGSKDGTLAIIKEYEAKYPDKVRVLPKENGGLSSARNIALRNICGKYVMFVDSDDMLLENTAQTLLKIAFENDADIVEGSHQVFNSSGSGACYIHDDKTAKNGVYA